MTPRSPDRCTRSHSCESCDSFANAAVVEEQLRQMQKQLNDIQLIPMQIQATLSYLTKTISKFVPPEMQREMPASMRGGSCVRDETIIEECEDLEDSDGDADGEERAEQPEGEGEEDDPEDEENFAGFFERLFDEAGDRYEEEPTDDGFGSDEEPEIGEEERLRLEKMERVSKLERSWPWSETAKPIHKRSNCHLVPSKTKIKQLDELPFYKRGFQQRFGN
ncbi:hypothetical protein pipiens_009694 [Culex pipiens pipiens]|uniref:Uncharacterized protein n=1 Tax=Culex pipiens pipiens TaxID=38569 RepID=A0ABD1DER3_CULPP